MDLCTTRASCLKTAMMPSAIPMPRVVCPARARDPRDAVLRPPRPPPPRRFLPPRLGPAPRARTDTSVRARARAAWRCTPALGVHLSMRATGPLERAWLRTFGVRKELRVGEEQASSMAHPGFNLGGRKQRVLWQYGTVCALLQIYAWALTVPRLRLTHGSTPSPCPCA